jgi:hypothetical protein
VTKYREPIKDSEARPLLRSLFQKAIRRGWADVAERVAFKLGSRGDSIWLNSRIGVILFEESWQCAGLLLRNAPTMVTLREIAYSNKNKDAAGLGAMAHALLEGNLSPLDHAPDPLALKIIAAALKRPEGFFDWAERQCSNEEQLSVTLAAKQYFSRATWPWDKAFMAAGAYLSLKSDIPLATYAKPSRETAFPYWVAVDKHTPQGKIALRKVASVMRIPEIKLHWISFYLESAKTASLSFSPWWECETRWRLSEIGLTEAAAADLWDTASPLVQAAVRESADLLRLLIDARDGYSLC